ncbi:MAG: hypothetical protein WDM77_22040 [Steroidobacteraceae bacterium]
MDREVLDADRLSVTAVCISYQFENGEAHPGQPVPVVREFDGPLESLDMRWGLIPYAARGDPGASPAIHVPLQDLSASHLSRGPWVNGQRCVQLATSFQFWKADNGGPPLLLAGTLREPGGFRPRGLVGPFAAPSKVR